MLWWWWFVVLTRWRWPGLGPGRARRELVEEGEREQRPRGLEEVSNTCNWGLRGWR